jgi:hypothetical protein
MVKRKKSEEVERSGQLCSWAGCMQPGDFRAPRSRSNLREYQWFCEEHIKEFNKQWNYFEGMSTEQIYEFQREATTGHRPTWRIDERAGNASAKLEEAFGRMFGDATGVYRADAKPIGARERDALAVLDLEHPSDKSRIKSQYRELVKKYHPDVNRGQAAAEETFKKVTRAYHHLMAHYVEK